MVDYKKAPKLGKPSWLKQELDTLNWDVLTYKIYVGDTLEKAIDWVVEVLNNILSGIDANFSAIFEWQEKTKDLINANFTNVNSWIDYLKDMIEALRASTEDALAVTASKLEAKIKNVISPVWEEINNLHERINKTNTALNEVIEKLKTPWWSPTRILEAIYDIVSPFKKGKEDTKNLFEWLWLFFDDPPLFLYEMADEIIVRFF